jgi:flavin-dependent dehydrogenase
LAALIAGAGPAGLATAARTRHRELLIVEQSKKLGEPPHCTGIVSPWTAVRLLGANLATLDNEGLLEAVYRRAVFLDKQFRTICSIEANPLAVKLRRPGIEEALAKQALDQGHRLLLRTRLAAAKQAATGVEAVLAQPGGTKRVTVERLLLATGAQASAPWRQRCTSLVGLEERVVLSRRISDEEFTTIHGSALAPGFFAWLAPIQGGREAVVGTAAPSGAGLAARLWALRRLLARRGLAEASRTLSRRGGVILRGPPAPSPVHGRLGLLGDTLCASKPYTGGGLYAIAELAPAAARWLETGDTGRLEGSWRPLRRELLFQHLATRAAVSRPWLFARLLRAACARAAGGGCRVDYDRHSSLAACLLLVPERVEEKVLLNRPG